MNAVDTNVFIYRLDRQEPAKQAKARDLLRRLVAETTPTIMLWQVLGELMRQLRYWQDQGEITREAMVRYVTTFRRLSLWSSQPHKWPTMPSTLPGDTVYPIGTACLWALARMLASQLSTPKTWALPPPMTVFS